MKKRYRKKTAISESKRQRQKVNDLTTSQDMPTTSSNPPLKTEPKTKDSQNSTVGTQTQKTQKSQKAQPQPDEAVKMVRSYLIESLSMFVRATATVLRRYNVSDDFIKAVMDEAVIEMHKISEEQKKMSEGN